LPVRGDRAPYRQPVVAPIKSATNSLIELGLALTHYGGKLPKRTVDPGGLARKNGIALRIERTAAREIDGEVKEWLRTAYDLKR
jgi:hypothetical protein